MTVKPIFSVPFKTYEELSGASGHHIYFRAPRIRARNLFEQETTQALVNGSACKLYDLSLSGLSAVTAKESADTFPVGEVVPVQIARANRPLFEGKGRIVRIEPTYRGNKVSLQFLDTVANIDDIRAKFSEEIFSEEAAEFSFESLAEIDAAYRVMCTEMLEFIRVFKTDIAHAERLNPRLASDEEGQRRLLDLCESRAMPHWEKFAIRGNAFIKAIENNPDALAAMKKLTVNILTPEFLGGPVWWQSYMKPFGYPGDFKMMNYIYDGRDQGSTLYDRFMHRLGVRLSHFIFTRMEFVRSHIEQLVDNKKGAPVNIMSLACGGAEDIFTYLSKGKTSGPLHITLVDQDDRALSYAYERAYPFVAQRSDGSTLRCLHASFTKLLKGGDFAGELPKQDIIYSLGLVDYLKARRAKLLTESLYEQVAPGGLLLLANLRESPTNYRWFAEMISDWDLIFRSEQDMFNLCADLQYERRDVEVDRTGQVYLLTVAKP